jgi:hypothetical protein
VYVVGRMVSVSLYHCVSVLPLGWVAFVMGMRTAPLYFGMAWRVMRLPWSANWEILPMYIRQHLGSLLMLSVSLASKLNASILTRTVFTARSHSQHTLSVLHIFPSVILDLSFLVWSLAAAKYFRLIMVQGTQISCSGDL